MRVALWCLTGANAGMVISAIAFGHMGNVALGLVGLAVAVHGLVTTRGAS